jgi:K+-transporting ATPase KdpF subunit
MNVDYVVGLVVTAALLAYLVDAMPKPEKF